jgi:diketogulonate reductase-like aldo/keto reductase
LGYPLGMKRRVFGWTREAIPVIGQGTWELERTSRAEAVRVLRAGMDAGMTLLDTAEMYGDGEAEEIVGEALAGRRDQVFLVTKVLPGNASRRGTVAACDRSLGRLGTDRIDLYLLHWPAPYPVEDTIAAFEELRQKGKIRYYGLSNFDTEGLDRAEAEAGPRGIASDQVLYHLKERGIEHEVLPWCERHEVALMAYSPFGQGNFPSPSSPGGKVLAAIARARPNTTVRQVALAFLIRRPAVFAIPKAATMAHALENAAAGDLALDPEEIARIEAAFPRGERPASLPTL